MIKSYNMQNLLKIYFVILLLFSGKLFAQTPENNYYHHPETILPYASLLLTLPDGSIDHVPFTPIIVNNEPAGINGFKRNIDLRGRLTFVGNGIVAVKKSYNAYGEFNLRGRVALMAYNIPESFQEEYGAASDLHIRVAEAANRGAVAVIIFGVPGNSRWNEPFISLPATKPPLLVPVIAIAYPNAQKIFDKLGMELERVGKNLDFLPDFSPIEMPASVRLSVKGEFVQVASPNFKVKYLPGILTSEIMESYVADRERAASFIFEYFGIPPFTLKNTEETFFPDLTSFKYYTNIDNPDLNIFGLKTRTFRPISRNAVSENYDLANIGHELAHQILMEAKKDIHPVFAEASAMIIEDQLSGETGEDLNKRTADFFKARKTTPIAGFLAMDNENHFTLTDTVSAQVGTFFRYLRNSYGALRFHKLFDTLRTSVTLKDRIASFGEIYFKEFRSLELEWLESISFKYDIPVRAIDSYLSLSENYLKVIMRDKN